MSHRFIMKITKKESQEEQISSQELQLRCYFSLRLNTSKQIRVQVKTLKEWLGGKKFYEAFNKGPDAVNQEEKLISQNKYNLIVQNIQEWKTQYYPGSSIFSQSIFQPLLLNYISGINFSSLKYLILQRQFIQSIEPLAWLNIPLIQNISLEKNEITSFKPLSKLLIRCQQFNLLQLSRNFFNHDQLSYLSRMGTRKGYDYLMFVNDLQTKYYSEQDHRYYSYAYPETSCINQVAKVIKPAQIDLFIEIQNRKVNHKSGILNINMRLPLQLTFPKEDVSLKKYKGAMKNSR